MCYRKSKRLRERLAVAPRPSAGALQDSSALQRCRRRLSTGALLSRVCLRRHVPSSQTHHRFPCQLERAALLGRAAPALPRALAQLQEPPCWGPGEGKKQRGHSTPHGAGCRPQTPGLSPSLALALPSACLHAPSHTFCFRADLHKALEQSQVLLTHGPGHRDVRNSPRSLPESEQQLPLSFPITSLSSVFPGL